MNGPPAVHFRPFAVTDRGACMALFDANCPEHFAPNERQEYALFLERAPERYEVCVEAGRVVGAFGLLDDGDEPGDDVRPSLRWIMIDPARQGRGLGSAIMRRVRDVARRRGAAGAGPDGPSMVSIRIAASHRSAPFFARFGAETVRETPDGWGPGMHRIDMELTVHAGSVP